MISRPFARQIFFRFCSIRLYAYEKWFQPADICEEWHKVFLYLCAVSDISWIRETIAHAYEAFLDFLEENICETMEAPSLISKEMYCDTLLSHVKHFRDFLKGDDEPVISKDLHHTMNSRYVYLPHLSFLLNEKVQDGDEMFSSAVMHKMLDDALNETDTYRKGTLWEDAAAYMLAHVDGWKITGRRIRAGTQEIDLSLINVSLNDTLWQLGAYILVECKNWNAHVDIHQIRNIAHISSMKGNKSAILFAANGITDDAQEEINRLAASNIFLICFTAEELYGLQTAEDCQQQILTKYHALCHAVDIATVI